MNLLGIVSRGKYFILKSYWAFGYTLLLVPLSMAVSYIGFETLARLSYELRGPENYDASMYWAVGRGIVNGLVPYKDLFETKPPGIFLLSGLSLYLFNGRILGSIGQMISLGMIAVIPLLAINPFASKKINVEVMFRSLTALLFGCLMLLYVAQRSGEYQVESFAVAWAMLYILLIGKTKKTFTWAKILLASLCFLFSVGFKEPLFLTMLAAAIVLSSSWKSFLGTFVLPAIIAAGIGLLVLWIVGYLSPFQSIYLTEMLDRHIASDGFFLLKAFQPQKIVAIVTDWNAFNSFFALSALFLLFLTLIHPLVIPRPRECWLFPLRLSLALILSVGAIYLGGKWFYPHHYVVIVPLLFALFLLLVRNWNGNAPSTYVHFSWLSIALLSLLAATEVPHTNYQKALEKNREWTKPGKTMAAAVDTLLTDCKTERYLYIGLHGPKLFGYTTHSPIGPLFYQFTYYLSGERSFFRSAFRQSLKRANLIVLSKEKRELNDLDDEVMAYIKTNFTTKPWPCAAAITMPESSLYQVFYRR